MHVHAQAMMTIREQERQEWLVEADCHRKVVTAASAGVPTLRTRRDHVGQMVRELAVIFRHVRSGPRSELA